MQMGGGGVRSDRFCMLMSLKNGSAQRDHNLLVYLIFMVLYSVHVRVKLKSWWLQDLHKAMKMLGLNPMEQEVVDIPNEIARLKDCRVIYNISS
jgi:hypothetical protein